MANNRHRRNHAPRVNDPTAHSMDGDAVLYLRVSSEGQVNTDYNPEGISLPAQRKAANERAHEIGAPVVTEFIDPGKTAKSIEHRDAFRDMISYLRAHPNVRYVVVYALSRFARNRYDDAIMMATLEKLGVHLVSATERNLDDTPAGRAMHGMLAVFNEYQVLVSGEDIKYKMGQKARSGGTLGIAKLGYQNVRIKYDGREIRTIAVDPERAPYVTMAFELYATGQYSFPELRDALTDAGLRTKGNRRYGPRPLSIHTIGNLLRDRYYLGYRHLRRCGIPPGATKPSSHPTSSSAFRRSSTSNAARELASAFTTTTSRAPSGALAASAGSSSALAPAKPETATSTTSAEASRNTTAICRPCRSPRSRKLSRITTHALPFPPTTAPHSKPSLPTLAQIPRRPRQNCGPTCDGNSPNSTDRKTDTSTYSATPIGRNRNSRPKCATSATTSSESPGNSKKPPTPSTPDALSSPPHSTYSTRPRELYDAATEHARKLLNKAIFTRLYVDMHPARQPTVATDDLQEPFGSLMHAIRTHTGQQPQSPQNATHGRQDDAQLRLGGLLASALAGQSASKAAMVELRGIEPLTFSMRTGGSRVAEVVCARQMASSGGAVVR